MSPEQDANEAGQGPAEESAGAARRRRLVTLLGSDPVATTITAEGSGSERGPGPPREREPEGNGVDGAGRAEGLRQRLSRLCAVTVTELGVSGAGITVMSSAEAGRAGHRDQLATTGGLSRRLEDLQLTTGEGPCLDAYDAGAPVLVGDLASAATRWLGFGPEAVAAGAAAVFSLPLQVGAIRLGTLDLYRGTTGALGREQLADAVMLAGLATETLLELVGDYRSAPRADGSTDGEPSLTGPECGTAGVPAETAGWLPGVHADVHVASGMVSAQAGIDVGAALLRIRAYAFASSEPIGDVARRILARDLVLDPPSSTTDVNPPDDGPPAPDPDPENE